MKKFIAAAVLAAVAIPSAHVARRATGLPHMIPPSS